MTDMSKYLAATLQDKPVKLGLFDANGKTEDYFMVIGSKSPRLKRAIAAYGVAVNKNMETVKDIECDIEKVMKANELRDLTEAELACDMVDSCVINGKQLSEADLLTLLQQNTELCNAVVSCSFDAGNYAAKK